MEHTKCLIIGSGPAGYTAAIYASRANLNPIEYCGMQPGGQLTQTTEVENFPGYPQGVDGNQMMMDLREQAERFGTDIRDGQIVKVDFSKAPYVCAAEDGTEIEADTVIIATGASAKYLGLDDERKYNGMGVSACATCDGFFYRKKTVAVVGGGDTACEDALYLSGLAKKVYLIVRKPFLRASQVMQQRVKAAENIEILFEHNTIGLFGENGVEGAHLVKRKGERRHAQNQHPRGLRCRRLCRPRLSSGHICSWNRLSGRHRSRKIFIEQIKQTTTPFEFIFKGDVCASKQARFTTSLFLKN